MCTCSSFHYYSYWWSNRKLLLAVLAYMRMFLHANENGNWKILHVINNNSGLTCWHVSHLNTKEESNSLLYFGLSLFLHSFHKFPFYIKLISFSSSYAIFHYFAFNPSYTFPYSLKVFLWFVCIITVSTSSDQSSSICFLLISYLILYRMILKSKLKGKQ